MSIVLAANSSSLPGLGILALMGCLTALSIVLARVAGVFNPQALRDHARPVDEEPAWRLFAILLVGIAGFFWGYAIGQLIPAANTDTRLTIINAVAWFAAFLAVVIMHIRYRPGGLAHLGLEPRRLLPGVACGILGLLIILPWVLWVSQAADALWTALGVKHETEHLVFRLWRQNPTKAYRVTATVTACLIAPLAEETLFRGLIQTVFLKVFTRRGPSADSPILPSGSILPPLAGAVQSLPSIGSRWAAIGLASLIFALFHETWSAPPIFLLSLGLGYAYERTGNLWASITMHALFNTIMVVVFLVAVQNA